MTNIPDVSIETAVRPPAPPPDHIHLFDKLMPPDGLRGELATLNRLITKARTGMRMELMLIDRRMALAMWSLLGENRNLTEAKIKRYHKIMVDGEWEKTHQGLMFDSTGRLRDGQHRLGAMIEYGKPLQIWVCFGCDPAAFKAVDQGEKRTASDLLSIEKIPNAHLCAATVNMVLRVENGQISNSVRILTATRMMRAQDDVLDTAVKGGGALRRSIKAARPSAMALAYYWIARNSQSKAVKLPVFWDNLATGVELKQRDARLKLRELLQNDPSAGGEALRGGGTSYGITIRQAGAVVNCWNNWVRGRSISMKELPWLPQDGKFMLPEEVF